jgi:serpin B
MPENTMDHGDSTYAARLYGQLRTAEGNLFFSPASVRIALAMTCAGARGETAAQLERTLVLPPGDAVPHRPARRQSVVGAGRPPADQRMGA